MYLIRLRYVVASRARKTGLLSSIGFRAYWIRHDRGKTPPVGFSWAILPVVVVLLVTSIYILAHSNLEGSWLRHLFSQMHYPQSDTVEELLPGVNVTVAKRKVLVDGISTADISDAREDRYFFTDSIKEKLNDIKRNSCALPPDKFRFRRVTINADKKTPFIVIKSIMQAARSTGYTEIQFVVVPKKR
jgi:biopolymer transport protein ExbD